jgi:uncharacterized protein DUF4124
MNAMARLASIAVALLVSGPAAAQMFKCTNAAGKITYSGTKCADLGLKDAGEVKDRVNVNPAYQPPPKAAPRQQPPRAATPPSPQPATARRDDDSCEAQKRRYQESLDCFAPYVNYNGSIKAEAFEHCVEVKQPKC